MKEKAKSNYVNVTYLEGINSKRRRKLELEKLQESGERNISIKIQNGKIQFKKIQT